MKIIKIRDTRKNEILEWTLPEIKTVWHCEHLTDEAEILSVVEQEKWLSPQGEISVFEIMPETTYEKL